MYLRDATQRGITMTSHLSVRPSVTLED